MKRLSRMLLSSAMLSISISPAYAMEEAVSITVEPTPQVYAYRFDTPAMSLSLVHDSHYDIPVTLTNLSTVEVGTDGVSSTPLRLATVRPHDQLVSPFYDASDAPSWVGSNRIRSDYPTTVYPNMQVSFNARVKAPSQPGKYLLALAPVLEGVTFFPGEPLLVEVIVDSDSTLTDQYKQATEKRLLIDISQQLMHQQIGGDTLNSFVVSTGKSGHDTPRGDYTIAFKNDVRYSSAYGLYMDNWMALSSTRYGFVGYGIHKLPYWKTKSGRIYEGADHLGRKVSHGCVRLGYEESKIIYDWSDAGMKVKVM
jgi:hypothetical protein